MTTSGQLERLLEDGHPAFAEPWHAEAYALVQVLIETGRVEPTRWTEAFGSALRKAAADGSPEDSGTYYAALADALGQVLLDDGRLRAGEAEQRGEAWRAAYQQTPHGKPVTLLGR